MALTKHKWYRMRCWRWMLDGGAEWGGLRMEITWRLESIAVLR